MDAGEINLYLKERRQDEEEILTGFEPSVPPMRDLFTELNISLAHQAGTTTGAIELRNLFTELNISLVHQASKFDFDDHPPQKYEPFPAIIGAKLLFRNFYVKIKSRIGAAGVG